MLLKSNELMGAIAKARTGTSYQANDMTIEVKIASMRRGQYGNTMDFVVFSKQRPRAGGTEVLFVMTLAEYLAFHQEMDKHVRELVGRTLEGGV